MIVFAKSPIPGFAKTRLVPALGESGAAELHRRLVLTTLGGIGNLQSWDLQLWCAGDINHVFFQECARKFDISLYSQWGETLGNRMFNAFECTLKEYEKVVIVGTDCPLLNQSVISQAFQYLDETPAVINPADDGGYVLLGLKKVDEKIFNSVDWGTSTVAEQTYIRLSELKWQYSLLPSLWDVDIPEDLIKLRELDGFYAFARE